MPNYKIIFDGDEQDEVFTTYKEAEDYAQYLVSCWHAGGEILEMSNPGDEPYDPEDEPEYEIVKTDEAAEKPDRSLRMFQAVVNSPGVYDDDGAYIRCPKCGHGLHWYRGVRTCPECGPVE